MASGPPKRENRPELKLAEKPSSPRSRFSNRITGKELDQMIFPELKWAVPGIIPEGSTMLVGPPKVGKSWLILGLALSIASGTKALSSIQIESPRPVLMLALEDGYRRFQKRSRTILGEDRPLPELLEVATEMDPKDYINECQDFFDKNSDNSPVVVLDTLGKVMPPSNSGESAYQRDYRIGSDIKRLVANTPGSSFIAIHHDRKAESDDFMDDVSGTNGLAGAADTIIVLKRNRQEVEGVLHVSGRDVEEDQFDLITENGLWRLDGPSLKEQKPKKDVGSRSQSILDYLATTQSASTADIWKAIGEKAKVQLHRLVNSNRVIRVGYDEYALPVTPTRRPSTQIS